MQLLDKLIIFIVALSFKILARFSAPLFFILFFLNKSKLKCLLLKKKCLYSIKKCNILIVRQIYIL